MLDTRQARGEGDWKGTARNARLAIAIGVPPARASLEQQTDKLLLEVQSRTLQGAPARALPLVDALTKLGYAEPDRLALRGAILAAADRTEEAVDAYERAIAAYFKQRGKNGEPPLALLSRHSELLAKLLGIEAPRAGSVIPAIETAAGPTLATHELRAEAPAGQVNTPPFPASATSLVVRWALGAAGGREPVEVRWIARSRGADRLIAMAQSQQGRTAGEFSLSRPDDGFLLGRYRLELRQGGRLIHAEDFTLR